MKIVSNSIYLYPSHLTEELLIRFYFVFYLFEVALLIVEFIVIA